MGLEPKQKPTKMAKVGQREKRKPARNSRSMNESKASAPAREGKERRGEDTRRVPTGTFSYATPARLQLLLVPTIVFLLLFRLFFFLFFIFWLASTPRRVIHLTAAGCGNFRVLATSLSTKHWCRSSLLISRSSP